ncbi:MAG: CoxG family protein [Rhodanobacteraceae bacterium]
MDMQGSRRLTVTQQQAWDALNDPAVLKACIPGCESIEPSGDNAYAIVNAIRVGPVAAKFKGSIQLTDIVAPDRYTLNFDGKGGAAGFGKGSARVALTPQGEGCELTYAASATVGGRIAQVGQRLIDGVAKSMAESFFKRFDEEMQRLHPSTAAAPATPPTAGVFSRFWQWLRRLFGSGAGAR